jgi:hypothetical protein
LTSNDRQFSSWYPLTDDGIEKHCPEGPAALQVRRADGLVEYPDGRSAMLFYYHTSDSAEAVLRRELSDEIDEPGVRGYGPLEFRYLTGEQSRDVMEDVLGRFLTSFDAPPHFNREDQRS